MPFVNPYMEKVNNNPYIMTDTTLIYKNKWSWNKYFGNNENIVLEIGTGMGNTFGYEIEKDQQSNFVGMEIKYKRLERTSEKALRFGGKSFVLFKDYGENIDKIFDTEEIQKTIIYFPDPWGKKENQFKNRLLSSVFLKNLFHITKKWWTLLFKTDHMWYFEAVADIIKNQADWKIIQLSYDYETDIGLFDKTKVTEFEAMYRGEDKKICFLELKKES